MFAVVLVVTLLSLANCAQIGDVAWSWSFRTSTSLSGWSSSASSKTTLVTPGYVSGASALQIATTSGDVYFTRSIDLSTYAGCTLKLSATIKANGVTQPSASYLGIKTMVSVTSTAGQTSNINKANVYGTFNWDTTKGDAEVPVPANLQSTKVTLGIQSSTGTVLWDEVKLVVIAVPVPPTLKPTPAPTVFTGHPGIQRLRGVMSPGKFVDKDFTDIQAWKPNVMRWQMSAGPGYLAPLSQYDTWLASELNELDQVLVAARRIGILILVDLHALPGGDDSDIGYALFQNTIYQDKLVSVWQTMARRYKGNTAIWAYDICNEPHSQQPNNSVPNWNSLAQRVINAIRQIDSVMPIMIESVQWANPQLLPQLNVMTGGNIIYSLHMYTPAPFTHQGAVPSHPYPGPSWPSTISGKYWDINALRSYMQPARTWQLQNNVWIHVGEFSAVRWADNAVGYLRDLITIFEEWGWDWTYHAYRECNCWSVEHGSDKNNANPVANTDRLLLLKQYFALNQNPYNGTGR